MESLSVHLMWVAAATYCALIAPKQLLATLIGVVGMVHFSIGRGSGSFIGGHLIAKVGIRQAFRVMGLGACIAGIFYGILHYYWLRNVTKTTDDDMLDNEVMEKSMTNVEPKFKDQSTMVSFERLSLMIEYNQIGSLSSLGRSRLIDPTDPFMKRARSNSIRRGSYSTANPKHSSGLLSKQLNISGKITVDRNGSAPKLVQRTSSIGPNDSELHKHLIPNEADEIIYATVKQVVGDKVQNDLNNSDNLLKK